MTKVYVNYYKSPHRRGKCVKLMVLKENLQKEEEKMMKKTDVVDQMIKKAAYHTAQKSSISHRSKERKPDLCIFLSSA